MSDGGVSRGSTFPSTEKFFGGFGGLQSTHGRRDD